MIKIQLLLVWCMLRGETLAKCLEVATKPLAQVNWEHKLRRKCLISGVSKLQEWLRVTERTDTVQPGVFFQDKRKGSTYQGPDVRNGRVEACCRGGRGGGAGGGRR